MLKFSFPSFCNFIRPFFMDHKFFTSVYSRILSGERELLERSGKSQAVKFIFIPLKYLMDHCYTMIIYDDVAPK